MNLAVLPEGTPFFTSLHSFSPTSLSLVQLIPSAEPAFVVKPPCQTIRRLKQSLPTDVSKLELSLSLHLEETSLEAI